MTDCPNCGRDLNRLTVISLCDCEIYCNECHPDEPQPRSMLGDDQTEYRNDLSADPSEPVRSPGKVKMDATCGRPGE